MVFVSLSPHSTAEMLNHFAIDSISEQSLGVLYLAIFMTPHYDLKQQEKQQWCFGGWAGVGAGGGSQTFLSYIWGVKYVFPTGLGGSSKFLPTT